MVHGAAKRTLDAPEHSRRMPARSETPQESSRKGFGIGKTRISMNRIQIGVSAVASQLERDRKWVITSSAVQYSGGRSLALRSSRWAMWSGT